MGLTLIVEPDPRGHRFQAVANVAAVAGQTGDVVLLTSRGAGTCTEFEVYLADANLTVDEQFDTISPAARDVARAVAIKARVHDISTAVVMDADQSLKRWWFTARRELKDLERRPRIVLMLTRYPARLKYTDPRCVRLRVAKGILAILARATGTADHIAGFAGRDDMSRGWVVRRARDPEICSAHARDRDALRMELGLDLNRPLVGIFGVIGPDKNPGLVLQALKSAGIDGDLVLAGSITPEVRAWLDQLGESDRARVAVRDGFLPNDVLDKHVAAVNAVVIAQIHGGPSGIMGKAHAAGVPVVSAGSEVRARELMATDAGEIATLDAASVGAAMHRVLERNPDSPRKNAVPPATADEFSRNLLGVDGDGVFVGMSRRR